jgi:hypothetical protein
VEYAFSKNIGVGFDSCSAPTFLAAMKGHPKFNLLSQLSESCESNRFSGYINVKGEWNHCSFSEDMPQWGSIDVTKITDFDKEVWHSKEVEKFRSCLICQDNSHISADTCLCPSYDLYSPEIGDASKKVFIMEPV